MKKRIITLLLLTTLTSSLLFIGGCGKETEPTPEPLPIEDTESEEAVIEEEPEEVVEETETESEDASNKATANLHRKEYKETIAKAKEAEEENTEFLVVDNDTKEDEKAETEKTDKVSTKTTTTTSTTTAATTDTTTVANANPAPAPTSAPAQDTSNLPNASDVVPVQMPETQTAEQPEYAEVPTTPITTAPTNNTTYQTNLTADDIKKSALQDTQNMIEISKNYNPNVTVTQNENGEDFLIFDF